MQHKKFPEIALTLEIKNCITLLPIIFSIWVFFFVCLYASSVLATKVYKWKDDQGRIHFTDKVENVPEEARDQFIEFNNTQKASNHSPDEKEVENDEIKKDIKTGELFIPFESKEGMESRIIIDVEFNNKVTVPMLLDTGSPGLVISADLASRLGLFEKHKSNLMVFISGIGGQQAAFRTVVDNISIGELTEEFIPAHIVPDLSSSFDGLIGMNMLSKYNITIDSINERLIVSPNPAAKDLPAGRNKLWWQRTFREFRSHKYFWETHAELVRRGKGPYAGMTSSSLERYEEAINYQAKTARNLYDKLTQFAKWRIVPMTWRK